MVTTPLASPYPTAPLCDLRKEMYLYCDLVSNISELTICDMAYYYLRID